MKNIRLTFLFSIFMSMVGAKAYAHDIEVKNSDGVTIYYVFINNETELAVSYKGGQYYFYSNFYSGDVVIPESVTYNGKTFMVTSIGSDAFYCCEGLTSVTIPNSVTNIGNSAFIACRSLPSIIIPNNVAYIGNSAFNGCSGLTSIIIPNGVTTIGYQAFYDCSSLTSLTIPNSVTKIGDMAFNGCNNLTIINIPVTNYSDFCNNQIVNWASSYFNMPIHLIDSRGNEINEYVIPEGVTSIGDNAFRKCIGITSVTIPNSVTSIGYSAFDDCTGLTSITIPNSVTSIGNYAFSGCTGLASVTIGNNVVEIGESTFSYCTDLTSITIPNSVTSIGKNAFAECNSLMNVKVQVTDYSEFCNNQIVNLISSKIGKPVYLIDKEGNEIKEYVIPGDVTEIGEKTFYNCSGLTSIIIPNSVTSIGGYAFYGCSNLTSVVIGSGVTSIGNDAFNNTNLKKTIWLTNTPPAGFNNAKGAVNFVSNDQFSSLRNVVKYQFLSSYFDVDGIRYVPVSPSERTCDAIDCVYNESAEETIIPAIAIYKGVTMTVKNIQPYLAYNNNYIKTLTIENDGDLGNYAFTDCSNINTVQLGEKITAIGTNAFQGCSSLVSVKALGSNSTLNGLYVPKSINSIGNYAFDGCSKLENIIIADSENELTLGSNGNNPLFASCPLDSVYIGRNISYFTSSNYGYSPFYRNTSLRAVKITDKETEISANEFYGCTNLQRMIIGDGVTTIGDWAYSGCQSLKFFAFGSQVQTIGKEAFSDCTSVIEIISKANAAPTCGAQALDDINKWDCKLYVPDGCLAAYQTADQWKDFFFAEEGEGTAGQGGDEQIKGKCEAPTISLKDGKLVFTSKTNGVIFHYSITHSDVKTDITNNEVGLTNTYNISVYASKEGYENSDIVTKNIDARGIKGDVDGDGVVDVNDVQTTINIILKK